MLYRIVSLCVCHSFIILKFRVVLERVWECFVLAVCPQGMSQLWFAKITPVLDISRMHKVRDRGEALLTLPNVTLLASPIRYSGQQASRPVGTLSSH